MRRRDLPDSARGQRRGVGGGTGVVAASAIRRGSREFRGGRSTEAWAVAVPSIDGRGARRNSGQGRGSDAASWADFPCKRA